MLHNTLARPVDPHVDLIVAASQSAVVDNPLIPCEPWS